MAEKPLSRELRICLAIWRKAYAERNSAEPVTVNCSNLNAAISIRQSMYRAAKPFRSGERFDEEVRLATELFVVYLEKQDDPAKQHRLILKHRSTLTELDAELEALGLSESDLLLKEEKLATSKLDEFLEKPDDEGGRATPFYTR